MHEIIRKTPHKSLRNFDTREFNKKSVDPLQIWLKSGTTNRYLTLTTTNTTRKTFIRARNVWDKPERKKGKNTLYVKLFRKSCGLRDNETKWSETSSLLQIS